jgi:photosystem II stability/assembly factor-like uncharacterized protein
MLRYILMIKNSFIIMIFNICAVYGQNYWLAQNSPTTKDFVMCSFADTSYGWACGDSGMIVNTTNAGVTWNFQNSGITNYKIEYIYFLNRTLGWAICNDIYFTGTIILKTTNGGVNWTSSRFTDTTVILNAVYYVDSLLGFLTGETGHIFKTTNGGLNWVSCFIENSACNGMFAKRDIHFLNSQTGYSCGGALDFVGIVWRTTNSGGNWSVHCLSPEPLNEVKPFEGNKVAAMGGDFEFGSNSVYSANNGSNWSYGLTECFGSVTGFSFRTPREVWAVQSFSNRFAVNLDSMKPGSVWQCLPTPDNSSLYDIEFTSSTMGWAFGRAGVIYKYNPSIIGINQNSNNLPAVYELFQNYPNPFNPATIIKYALSSAEYIKLTVYDAEGREIKILNEGIKQAGIHSVEFEADEGLASGIYFYILTAGSYSSSRKMVVIK